MRARTQYAARSLTGHSCNEGRTRRLCHIPQQNGPQEIERKALKIMLCSGAAARRGSISQWSRGPSTLSRRCARTLHVCPKNQDPTGGYTQNGTFSEFCILSRHLDRFCSSKRPRGPRGPPELPNDKKTAAPRLLDRLLFRYPPPQIRLKWDVLSVTFNGKFQR